MRLAEAAERDGVQRDALVECGVPLGQGFYLGRPVPVERALAHAASRDRLPTIRAADRHLVYLDTIHEAERRGLLHGQRGRPRGAAARRRS